MKAVNDLIKLRKAVVNKYLENCKPTLKEDESNEVTLFSYEQALSKQSAKKLKENRMKGIY